MRPLVTKSTSGFKKRLVLKTDTQASHPQSAVVEQKNSYDSAKGSTSPTAKDDIDELTQQLDFNIIKTHADGQKMGPSPTPRLPEFLDLGRSASPDSYSSGMLSDSLESASELSDLFSDSSLPQSRSLLSPQPLSVSPLLTDRAFFLLYSHRSLQVVPHTVYLNQ